MLVLGLAPAAHGANRTGRVFTGDRSGEWLYRAMYRAGLANQPTSVSVDDGLSLTGAWVTAVVKCAPPDNKPLPQERADCHGFFQREVGLLTDLKVVVCLGAFAYQAACAEFEVRPRPKFGHGVEVDTPNGLHLVCSFHPSQQNTFTGRLTEADARRGVRPGVGAQRLSARPTATPARWLAAAASSRKSASEKKPWYIPPKRTWLVGTPSPASRAA